MSKKNIYKCRSSAYAAAAGAVTLGCSSRLEPAGSRQRVPRRAAEEGTIHSSPRLRGEAPPARLTPGPRSARPHPCSKPTPQRGWRQAEGQRRPLRPDPAGQRLPQRGERTRGTESVNTAPLRGRRGVCGRQRCSAQRRAEKPGAGPDTKWFPPAVARSRRPQPRTQARAGPYRDILPPDTAGGPYSLSRHSPHDAGTQELRGQAGPGPRAATPSPPPLPATQWRQRGDRTPVNHPRAPPMPSSRALATTAAGAARGRGGSSGPVRSGLACLARRGLVCSVWPGPARPRQSSGAAGGGWREAGGRCPRPVFARSDRRREGTRDRT